MARLSQTIARKLKFTRLKSGNPFSVRTHHRCPCCGRPRGYMRKFMLCRICFRKLALQGEVPGVIKSSW